MVRAAPHAAGLAPHGDDVDAGYFHFKCLLHRLPDHQLVGLVRDLEGVFVLRLEQRALFGDQRTAQHLVQMHYFSPPFTPLPHSFSATRTAASVMSRFLCDSMSIILITAAGAVFTAGVFLAAFISF